METTAKLFAANLKRLREERNLTQEALSERLGSSVVTISNYENGRRWPEPETLDAICRAFGVSPDDLVRAPSVDTALERPAKLRLFEMIAALNDDEAKLLLPGFQALLSGLSGPKNDLEPHQEDDEPSEQEDSG